MLKDNAKIRTEIKRLEEEVTKQRIFCKEKVLPHIVAIVTRKVLRERNPFYNMSLSHNGIKLTIKLYKVRVKGYGRRRKTVKRLIVAVRYKYRTVLRYEFSTEDGYTNLKVFHACKWLEKLSGFVSGIEEKFRNEDLKIEEKRLKDEAKRLGQRCDNFAKYCEVVEE